MKRALVSCTVFVNPSRKLTMVNLVSPTVTLDQAVLVDSGADDSFIDEGLVERFGLSTEPLHEPREASALDGRPLCMVMHRSQPFVVRFPDGHSETVNPFVYCSSGHPLVLGHPWLVKHKPHFDWSSGKVLGWGEECVVSCFSENSVPADLHTRGEFRQVSFTSGSGYFC